MEGACVLTTPQETGREAVFGGAQVLHVAMRLDPAIGGSTASTVSNIVAEERAGLKRTVVFCAGPDDDSRTRPVCERLAASGAKVFRLPRAQRPARAAAQFGLSRTAATWLWSRVRQFDVVHVHGPWGYTSACAIIAARRAGVPVVLTPRESLTTHDVQTSKSRLRAATKMGLLPIFRRNVDVVIYTSQIEQRDSGVEGRFGSSVVFHAVVDETEPVNRVRRRAIGETVVMGFLGRFDPKKNLPLLIDAVASDRRLRLILAGSGTPEIEKSLRQRVESRGLGDRVSFWGYVDPAGRERLFSSIDVLALPSNFENFGMAAAEAMVRGVPVIVGEKSGVGEVVAKQGGGRVVSVEVDQICAAALDLSSAASREHLADQAQSVVRQNFSYQAHAQAISSVYRTLF